MIGQLLGRLEGEHGRRLVAAALGYLAAALNGLTENEELDLLSANTEVDQEVSERFPRSPAIEGRVPPVLWARLYSDLEPYLVQRPADGRVLLGFFHRQLADEIRSRYLAGDAAEVRHRELAGYFVRQPLLMSDVNGAAPNLRKLSELPHQQSNGALWKELYATLTDFRFLEAKVTWSDVEAGTDTTGAPVQTHNGVYALEEDFRHALDRWPSPMVTWWHDRKDALSALLRAVRRESDVLADHPDLAWQQLVNRLQWSPGAPADLVDAEAGRRAGGPWLRLRTRFPESSALVRRLNPRSDDLSSCALTPTGSLAVSTGMDGTVGIWNPASGRQLRVLRGAGQPVTCAVTPDGRFALAAGGDGTLRVWRISDGQKVADVAAAHQGSVNACAVLPGGGAAITFAADGTVRTWRLPDLDPGDPLAVDAGHLTFGALSMDGTTIAYGNRESSRVVLRRVQRGGPGPVLLDAGSAVMSCAFGTTPTVVLTGHVDGTLSAWRTPEACCEQCRRTTERCSTARSPGTAAWLRPPARTTR